MNTMTPIWDMVTTVTLLDVRESINYICVNCYNDCENCLIGKHLEEIEVELEKRGIDYQEA